MKLAIVSTYFRDLVAKVERETPGLYDLPFNELDEKLSVGNYCPHAWAAAFREMGYETLVVPINAPDLLQVWGKENGHAHSDNEALIAARIKAFKPDLLIYNHVLPRLLRVVKQQTPSLKSVCVLFGQAIMDYELFKLGDFYITSSPVILDEMNALGLDAHLIHHGYDARMDDRIEWKDKFRDFIFSGSVLRKKHFHFKREQLLVKLVEETPLELYSRSYYYGAKAEVKTLIKQVAFLLTYPLKALPPARKLFYFHPLLEELLALQEFPARPVNRKLKPRLKPPMFGIPMFQLLQESRVVLNTHGDSQEYACNMRLFEATGVATCLLTDWKPNLHELFEDGAEVVTWKTPEECAEKARWLLDNPAEAEAIGKAARARVMKEHTVPQRAAVLEQMFRERI